MLKVSNQKKILGFIAKFCYDQQKKKIQSNFIAQKHSLQVLQILKEAKLWYQLTRQSSISKITVKIYGKQHHTGRFMDQAIHKLH